MGSTGVSNRKAKILFVTRDLFPPFRVDVKVLFGEELVSKGYIIDWLLQSGNNCKHSYQTCWSQCSAFVGPNDLGKSFFRKTLKYIYGILNDLKIFSLSSKNKYDVIQVKGKFIAALLAIIASKLNNTMFCYWLSYPFPEADLYKAKNRLVRYPFIYFLRGSVTKFLLYKLIMSKADHIFVQSEQMKKDVIGEGISADKITSVPMGIRFTNTPGHSNKPKKNRHNTKIVLYLGTLVKVRRMDFLIKAFQKVLFQVPSAKLYIIGDSDNPDDVQKLKNEAKRLSIGSQIVFWGFLPMQEAWEFVKDANVCVSPFYPTPILNSTSPTKLIEYMAFGRPVVANDHPEQSLVINESQGGLCVKYLEEEFAKAIVTLLNDNEKAEEMGHNAMRYVEKYRTYQKIAQSLDETYAGLLIKR